MRLAEHLRQCAEDAMVLVAKREDREETESKLIALCEERGFTLLEVTRELERIRKEDE